MKTFRYSTHDKFPIGSTMTVSELREKLNEYPQDMPVLATWEGIHTFFAPESFKVERYGGGSIHHEDACDCVVIDVDQR
jgi:hypothetical protein